MEGEPFSPGDRAAARNVGRFLARFHAALTDDIPSGKEGFLREDHPDLLLPYVRQLEELCRCADEAEQVRRIGEQIELVRENLDERLWPRLPKAVTHGDIHPGNVRFKDSRVAAVYDFDYLSVQARVHDIATRLIFFAARRDSALEPNNIWSLTQPFVLDADLARVLLDGYQEIGQTRGRGVGGDALDCPFAVGAVSSAGQSEGAARGEGVVRTGSVLGGSRLAGPVGRGVL